MERRDFLKLSLGGVALAAIPAAIWHLATAPELVQAEAFGERFRGTSTGRVLVAGEGGSHWQVAADFSEDCPVLGMTAQDDQLLVKLGFQGFDFYLKSSDGRNWRSLEA